jgi:hypothetical protein
VAAQAFDRTARVSLDREHVLALMLHKQHLAASSATVGVTQVMDDLIGLHATDRLSPYLQLQARLRRFAPDQLDALLDAGQAARLGCMRQTLFIESAVQVPLLLAATRALAARGHERFLAANGLEVGDYERLASRVAGALTGRALDARELQSEIGATRRLSPVLIVMCDQARIVRWKGAGGWRSGGQTYRLFEEALPTVGLDTWDETAAFRELVDRYVRRYGPVTVRDIAWWTGFGQGRVRAAVATLPGLALAGMPGVDGELLIDEADLVGCQRGGFSAGEVSLLPVLDPFLQGYRDRERSLDPRHRPFVVDRGGNVTSVILVDGRVAGVWDLVEAPARELRLFFFEPPAAHTRCRVHGRAADVAELLTGGSAPVIEVDRMTTLTERRAGAVLSPLGPPSRKSR